MKLVRDSQQRSGSSIKPVEELNKEILLLEDKLLQLHVSLQKKERDVERLQAVNSNLIENNLGYRPSASVQSQQAFLVQAKETINGLIRVKKDLESRRDTLAHEKALSAIYQDIKCYSQQEKAFTQQTQAVFDAIKEANKVLETVHKAIQEYLFIPAQHLEGLSILMHHIKGLSYRDFIEGTILECDSSINHSFIADLAHRTQKLSFEVPQLGDISKDMQALQSKLLLIARHVSSLVPKSERFIQEQPAKPAIPIQRDRPPKQFIEIRGVPYRYDEALERYVKINPVSKPEEAPAWGLMPNSA